MSLVIDYALEPENGLATPQAGGALEPSTVYYYRVAAVTERGDVCASSSFSGTTTEVNKTLVLTWDVVAGVKTVGGYKIYRNTLDSWTSGDLLLKTVDTNSYTDDGSDTPGEGVPMTFTCTKVQALPIGKASLIPEVPVVGGEGGAPSYLGGYPEKIQVQGYLRGATAKVNLDKLGAIRYGGLPCSYTFTAFSVTLINGTYLINSLSYWPEPATPNDVDALVLRFILELIEAS